MHDRAAKPRRAAQPVEEPTPDAQRIRDALAGQYDAPIRLDTADGRAGTHASGEHADALHPAAVVRLPTGDERVGTAEEDKILRKAKQIAARRLQRVHAQEAQEAERQRLAAIEEEAARFAMQQDEPPAEPPAPHINQNVAMNPDRAQKNSIMRKWSMAGMWASSVPDAQQKEAQMQQKFEAQEEGRTAAEEPAAGEPKPTPRAENILAKLSATKFRAKNAAKGGSNMNSPFAALAPEPLQVCARTGACSSCDVHLCKRTRTHTDAHTLSHTLIHTHTRTYANTHTHTHTHTSTHTHTHTHTHTRTHAHRRKEGSVVRRR